MEWKLSQHTHKLLGASISPDGSSKCKSPSLENISVTYKYNVPEFICELHVPDLNETREPFLLF